MFFIRTWGDPSYGGIYASGYNLALGKPATQSSNSNETDYHASQAVNGNTDGVWYNNT
jgi:hypothetical protein